MIMQKGHGLLHINLFTHRFVLLSTMGSDSSYHSGYWLILSHRNLQWLRISDYDMHPQSGTYLDRPSSKSQVASWKKWYKEWKS